MHSMRTKRMVRLLGGLVGLTVLGVAVGLAGVQAQEAQEKKEPPPGWKMRLDRPDADASGVAFRTMAPGWHITTGPACILWHPEKTAKGSYHIVSETFLFDPGTRREGYGIFFGGQNLEAENQSYTYFLIRRDGRFLIKKRKGSDTEVVTDWTEHPAITKHAGGEGTAKNLLEVDVGDSEVAFFVNDQKVAGLPRAQLQTDGIVGLRINHALNVHVTNLEVMTEMKVGSTPGR